MCLTKTFLMKDTHARNLTMENQRTVSDEKKRKSQGVFEERKTQGGEELL